MQYDEYLSGIQKLVIELNNTPLALRGDLLKKFRELDKEYLGGSSITISQQLMFTRHGECNRFSQKRFGLNPNAGLSNTALKTLDNASLCSSDLLLNPKKSPQVIVSPLLRSMQTAAFILPKNSKSKISINNAISENSTNPSSYDIRSPNDYKLFLKSFPFFSYTRFKFFISSLFYGAKTFKNIEMQRGIALKKLAAKDQDPNVEFVTPPSFISDGEKIDLTVDLIKNSKDSDLWLIGHGKNFRNFFKEIFGLKINLKPSETKIVYKIYNQNQAQMLFVPPYSISFDLKTGASVASYTGFLKAEKGMGDSLKYHNGIMLLPSYFYQYVPAVEQGKIDESMRFDSPHKMVEGLKVVKHKAENIDPFASFPDEHSETKVPEELQGIELNLNPDSNNPSSDK